jgi:hypothetical protein
LNTFHRQNHTSETDMSGQSWRLFLIPRRYQDHLITLLCVGVLVCGLIAWAFDIAGAWEIFGIGALVAGAVVLASAILG